MYAIHHRQHDNGTWYWAVHFQRIGKPYERRFYEPKYGGSSKAMTAAKAWRDQQLSKTKALTIVEFCQQARSNNTSGVPGVHFLRPLRQPEGIWQAKLKVGGGKYQSRAFSVLLHGYEKAYELAVAARKEMLANVKNRPYVFAPVARRLAPSDQQ